MRKYLDLIKICWMIFKIWLKKPFPFVINPTKKIKKIYDNNYPNGYYIFELKY